jgi:hypothetical protein
MQSTARGTGGGAVEQASPSGPDRPPRGPQGVPEVTGLGIHEYRGIEELPGSYAKLFNSCEQRDVRLGRAWLEAVMREGVPVYGTPLLLGFEDASGLPLALCPGFVAESYAKRHSGRALVLAYSGETPYCPLAVDGIPPVDIFRSTAHYVRRSRPPYDVLRISPIDRDGALFEELPDAMRAAGWIPQRFFLYYNWHGHVAGMSSEDFLSARPARLRNTIVRRTRRLEKSGRLRIAITHGGPEFAASRADYELVFARSWKKGLGEVSADFLRAIMRAAAQTGALRLALLYLDNEPAAAQLWLISGGVAFLHRLAYDERFRDLSPGTVLTWYVVREMLDAEKVGELDLGVGDDSYKADWVPDRRERWGIVGFNPRTPGGLKAAAVNIGGRGVKRVLGATLGSLMTRRRA